MADRLHVRRATAADHDAVRALLADDISKHRRCFGDFDVEWLLQTSAMGVVAEADDGTDSAPVCGFASFIDAPVDPHSRELSDRKFLDWYRPRIEAAGAADADEARVSEALFGLFRELLIICQALRLTQSALVLVSLSRC